MFACRTTTLSVETVRANIPLVWLSGQSQMSPKKPSTPGAGPGAGAALDESTHELLDRVRQGDQAALSRLYARYLLPLRRWARGRLPHWARDLRDTDDVVQDVLLQTLHRVGNFEDRGPGALQAYLREALLNRVRDECRRVQRRPGVAEIVDDAAAIGPSPLEEAIGAEALARYDAALARLPIADREAIVARVEMGCSFREIAEMLGKPSADAARMTVTRALVRVAEEMHHAG